MLATFSGLMKQLFHLNVNKNNCEMKYKREAKNKNINTVIEEYESKFPPVLWTQKLQKKVVN